MLTVGKIIRILFDCSDEGGRYIRQEFIIIIKVKQPQEFTVVVTKTRASDSYPCMY